LAHIEPGIAPGDPAIGEQQRHGVDVPTFAVRHLIVDVRAGREAGAAEVAELLALRQDLADPRRDAFQVPVEMGAAKFIAGDHGVAVTAPAGREHDRLPLGRRQHGRAERAGKIDGGMPPALVEQACHAAIGERHDELDLRFARRHLLLAVWGAQRIGPPPGHGCSTWQSRDPWLARLAQVLPACRSAVGPVGGTRRQRLLQDPHRRVLDHGKLGLVRSALCRRRQQRRNGGAAPWKEMGAHIAQCSPFRGREGREDDGSPADLGRHRLHGTTIRSAVRQRDDPGCVGREQAADIGQSRTPIEEDPVGQRNGCIVRSRARRR